ncbi:alpha-amylase [bacterium]|nr:alpha-amylase [bacterium]
MIVTKHILLALVMACFAPMLQGQSITRMEPPNWWTHMQLNTIELMVYGDGIAGLEVAFEGGGLRINQVIQAENEHYLFINLSIDEKAAPGKRTLLLKKGRKTLCQKDFWIYERQMKTEDYQGFGPEDAIYLITPDRFANGNTANDNNDHLLETADRNNMNGRHGGDIEGIDKHLDYLQQMGFTAVWINPLLENNMEKYSYHGYSVTDFYQVDARYGSNEDYKNLVTHCREKNMKVIMDMIANHCGLNHWWMQDLPWKNWINTWPEYTETNHRKITILDPHASQRDKEVYLNGWFVPTMPDLNQRNPFLANYLIQNSIWWVEYLELSGIRMDTYSYSDPVFLAKWSKTIMDEYPNFSIVGEEWFALPTEVSYWQAGKHNEDGYQSYLKSLCDFPLEFSLVTALNEEESFSTGLIKLYEMLGHDYLYPQPEYLLTFADNHDMSRIYTQLHEDYNKYLMAVTFIATTRGIPMFYYGTEILMSNPKSDAHGEIRSDFAGGWPGDAVNGFTGDGLSEQQKAAQVYLKHLLNWRKTSAAVQHGKLMHFEVHDGLYVYFRYTDSEKVMVVMNKNEEETLADWKEYEEILPANARLKNVMTGEELPLQDVRVLPAMSVLVFEII